MSTKKIISALLALMMACALASCGSGDTAGGADTTAAGDGAVETTAAVTEPIIDYRSANLPDKDFGGYDFRFVMSDASSDYAWYHLDAEQNGEALNDAIYERNANIEEAFNVVISEVQYANSEYQNKIKNVMMAGDDAFDSLYVDFVRNHNYVQSDLLIDLFTVDYIDLEAEWWDQSVIRDVTLNDRLYWANGDISPNVNMRTYSFVFNKDLMRELALDDPYQLVLDGEWTFDVFKSYVTGVNADMNGDGVMDYEDRWGFFSENYNTCMMYISGGGEFVVTNEAQDNLEYRVLTEANIDRLTSALELMNDENVTLLANPYVTANNNSWTAASNWYAEGNALIRSSVLEPIPRDYRTMDTDFGVLPLPKYDEAQEEYLSMAGASGGRFISIPVTQIDLERTGIILEALAAESVSTVTTAFYDVCLEGKYLRDEESTAMLDIIFDGKTYDWGYILGINGMHTALRDLELAKNNDAVSKMTSLESAVLATLSQYMEHY